MRKRKNLEVRMERASERLILRPEQFAGQWRGLVPGCTALWAELGCGMGRFACETALANPGTLTVALEKVPGAVIAGMERAQREDIPNIRFIISDAGELGKFFAPGEIDALFIHHPDPWPHWKHAPRRLMARNFLEIYRLLLAPGGFLRFKTDDAALFAFAQKELATVGWTVAQCEPDSPPEAVMSEYEIKFRGKGAAIGALTACI